MKKLPIGIQTFSEIIEDNHTYVDKTSFVKKLVDNGKYYFLSRPRRFGKSLFLDTLKEAFEGNEKLFKGLNLEKNWDWSRKYPVIKISFGGGIMQTKSDLESVIRRNLVFNQERLGVVCKEKESQPNCLAELIQSESKTNTALEQIKAKKYQEKYRQDGMTIYLIGILFSKEKRNIVKHDWEKYN